MNTFSTQAPKSLVVLLASIAVVATGCGAVKSGFNTDPLAGNARYKQMQQEGKPQVGDQAGLPNPVPVVDQYGVPYNGSGSGSGSNQIPVGPAASEPAAEVPASIPQGEDAPVPTAAASINKITLQAVPLPETQVLNFVEGQPSIVHITVQDSKGKATQSGLPTGATFKKISEDVYEIKWIPAAGLTGKEGELLKTLKINVGTKRQHNVLLSVVSTLGLPTIEKVSLAAASISPGDAVALQVIFKDGEASSEKAAVYIEGEEKSSAEVRKLFETAKISEVVASENGRLRADIVLETKGIKFAANEKTLRFVVAAGRGKNVSVAIPQVIKLNQVAQATTKAASNKKATGDKK